MKTYYARCERSALVKAGRGRRIIIIANYYHGGGQGKPFKNAMRMIQGAGHGMHGRIIEGGKEKGREATVE
jgi:hypothetical protein